MASVTGHTIDVVEILTQAVEAAAGIASVVASFKVLSLSKKYYELYKDQRDFYVTTFVSGLETPLAAEVYADVPYVLNHSARVATAYNTITGPFGGRSTDAASWWSRHGAAYNTPNDARLLKELTFDLARIKTDWTNYLFRLEEQFYDTANDIRWRKRIALHNIGIRTGTAVTASLDSALGMFVEQMDDFGDTLATYGNGIAKYAGYKRGLADAADSFNAMEYTQRVPSQQSSQQSYQPDWRSKVYSKQSDSNLDHMPRKEYRG
ncbi:MAG: hypothetical protein V4649_19550 [Bacteroidota bacterium]